MFYSKEKHVSFMLRMLIKTNTCALTTKVKKSSAFGSQVVFFKFTKKSN